MRNQTGKVGRRPYFPSITSKERMTVGLTTQEKEFLFYLMETEQYRSFTEIFRAALEIAIDHELVNEDNKKRYEELRLELSA